MKTNTGWSLGKGVILFLSILLSSSISYSVQISDVQYYLNWGDAFSASNQKFFISEDYSYDDAEVTGIMKATGEDDYYYEIRGGSIDIAPSGLLDDFSGGGVAVGYFASGATVNITGSIWRSVPGQTAQEIFASGTLLSAVVQQDFYVAGDEFSPGSLFSQLDLGITGGELLDGNQTGLKLVDNHMVADISLLFCTQKGRDVTSFATTAGDISYLSSYAQMYAAPEPCTILLLGLGSVVLRLRKK